jgi:eukaryotic-like serine/threonine-protein kinase
VVKRVELLAKGDSVLLGRYQLIGSLASGGMATVFLARLAGVGGFQRMVAIKRLHPHLATEDEFVEMFVDEARLAASIHHQNVVPILEIEQSEGGYYLVMEYIEGLTLARLLTHTAIDKSKVAPPLLLRMIIDSLNGLHAAHELVDEAGHYLNVVHRDCTPQNILVGLDGCTRITDFGVARARSRLANTRDGAMKGKLAYMAPEQAHGEAMDRRADLFSVATVAWEALTGRRLFKRKTEPATLKRVLQGRIPRLSDVIKVHPDVDAVIAKGLQRDPDKRWSTAAEFADAIEAAARAWGDAEGLEEPIATNRTVATMMKGRYGSEIAAQRDEVNLWLKSTPSNAGMPPPRGTLRGLPRVDPEEEEATVLYDSSVSAPATAVTSPAGNKPEAADRARGLPARLLLGVSFLALGVSLLVFDAQKSEGGAAQTAPKPTTFKLQGASSPTPVGARSAEQARSPGAAAASDHHAKGRATHVDDPTAPASSGSAAAATATKAPQSQLAKPNAPKPNAPKPNAPKPNAPKPNAPKPQPAKPQPAKPQPAKPRPAKPQPAKPQPAKTTGGHLPKPAPKVVPKPKPVVEDDLSNPYR